MSIPHLHCKMASKGRISPASSSPPISSMENCGVIMQANNFTYESNRDTLYKTTKIKISEKIDEGGDVGGCRPEKRGNYCFELANPKDSTDQALLQEVLTLYMKELPAMNFAANTGKESMFLQRCVTNGKYCTLVLKSKDDRQPGEVIAAITYQIIPADTQCAEVPLAAVYSIFQHKGIGSFLFLELRKRLRNVGVRTIYCWGDKESEGFWVKQGFSVIGEVPKRGRARKLPIRADIRRALCFPGGSTLMSSQLLKDSSSELMDLVSLCLPTKPPQLNFMNQELTHIARSKEPSKEDNQIAQRLCSESEKLGTEKVSVDIVMKCSAPNASRIREGGSEGDEEHCSYSDQGTKRRMWETTYTSLKSKKVKGTHSNDCELGSNYSNLNNISLDALRANSGNDSLQEKVELQSGEITNRENCSPKILYIAQPYRIMLMNIADEAKKSCLTKLIEDLGGAVASDGCASTHVVTGKVRKTLNFCTALCSGAWVVSPGWLKESFKKGRFVDEVQFILNDEDYLTKYRMELKSAVVNVKASPGSLLKGLDIWLAAHVHPPINTLSAIVKAAGGNVIRTKKEIKDVSVTIFVACEEDMDEALSAVRMGIWTFSSDWLMNCIMRQKLDLDAPQFAESL